MGVLADTKKTMLAHMVPTYSRWRHPREARPRPSWGAAGEFTLCIRNSRFVALVCSPWGKSSGVRGHQQGGTRESALCVFSFM